MNVLRHGTLFEKLLFQIDEEISVFINYNLENVVTEPEARQLISQEVVPRLSRLRDIIHEYQKEQK